MLRLNEGFALENPRITIPWGLSRTKLAKMLAPYGVRRPQKNYFTLDCTSLGGLSHELGIEFDPQCRSVRFKLQIFLKGFTVEQSFPLFQRHLEAAFGPPTETTYSDEPWPAHYWEVDGFSVSHVVIERFGYLDFVSIAPKDYRLSMRGKVALIARLCLSVPPVLLLLLALQLLFLVLWLIDR